MEQLALAEADLEAVLHFAAVIPGQDPVQQVDVHVRVPDPVRQEDRLRPEDTNNFDVLN